MQEVLLIIYPSNVHLTNGINNEHEYTIQYLLDNGHFENRTIQISETSEKRTVVLNSKFRLLCSI